MAILPIPVLQSILSLNKENPTMAAPSFFALFVNVFFLISFSGLSVATNRKDQPFFLSSASLYQKTEADKHNSPTIQQVARHSGYYRLPHSHDARMFYYFFESQNNRRKDPVVIWLTGGPGCASALPLFFENGPFRVTKNMTLARNEYGWDKVFNLIYVDQPTGTGFSHSSNINDIRLDQAGVSNDLYDFLQVFFKERPHYANNNFYIAGESYGGHFIPALATRIHQGNKNKEGIHINLKGMAIGNGFTNPEIQLNSYIDYALAMNLIKESDYQNMSKLVHCQQRVVQKSCTAAYDVCLSILSNIIQMNDGINIQDIRKKCIGKLCYDLMHLESFLNQKSVRDALGVEEMEFASCNKTVFEAMIPDMMRNLDAGIPRLLEDGIQLLVYAGEYDLTCNWLGNWKWVKAMEWSGQKNFQAAPTVPFTVDGAEAGLKKSHGPLVFLKVYDAGQLVPTDQPKASLEMLKRWVEGNL